MDNRIIAAALVGVAAGFGAGFYFGRKDVKRRLENEYAELAYQDIESVKEHYKQLYKEGEYSDPTTLAAARGLIQEEQYSEIPEDFGSDRSQRESMETARELDLGEMTSDEIGEVLEGVNRGTVEVNVFDEHDEERENLRAQGKPFIISNDEFGEEHGWDSLSISYFEEDDVLMDTDEKPIDNVEKLIGRANLSRFGEISGDPNILYVRNEAIRTDFEIAKEEGSYSKTVMGIDPEPPVRRKRPRPRMSDDDE